ncbi:MAG: hypothetical protein PVF77_18205, partial [Anaerolineae bacterium]
VSVDDDLADDESCPADELAPDDSLTCTASHPITQADLDAGSVMNMAFASGQSPSGDPVTSPTDSTTVTAIRDPALAIQISASPTTYHEVGDVIQYIYLVTNTGNVTISSVSIDDDLADDESCPAGDLAPDDSLTCTASYTITQADVDAGSVTNVAFATGRDPNTDPVTSPTDSATVEFAESYTVYLPIVYR